MKKLKWKLHRVTESGKYVFVTYDFWENGSGFYHKILKTEFWA